MKYSILIVFLSMILFSCSGNNKQLPSPSALKGADAFKAMEIANKWFSEGRKVKSFVTTEGVHFEFTNGEKTTVQLPAGKVVIAVAPYLTFTHT